jgi:hypothetical protein
VFVLVLAVHIRPLASLSPDYIHLTAVTTPFSLYEWLVMPMGLRNSPPTHQHRMVAALHKYIGKICHVYLDDIIIWSQSTAEHVRNVHTILKALRETDLFCSLKKTQLFCVEIDFLGHHISTRGLQPDASKIQRILNWPTPRSAKYVHAFLGLVRYIASFLPKLAEHTRILTPLTEKCCDKNFPAWTAQHHSAFEAIKSLVVGADCLTTIDHQNPGDNRIFMTTDASDWRLGAVLSFGPSWQTARPVAFDSIQLCGPELNYPVHEKELLAIVHALKKWRVDLLGLHFTVYTDHRTLENFDRQKDLSHRQAHWQEFLSQYNMDIKYIPGDMNTVADALSRLPADEQPTISPLVVAAIIVCSHIEYTESRENQCDPPLSTVPPSRASCVCAVTQSFTIASDPALL